MMKKIVLPITLQTLLLNTSPTLFVRYSKFKLKQTNHLFKHPRTKRSLIKDLYTW